MNIESKNKSIRQVFFALIVAFLFFFNANINIIDPLPDIIGYIILSVSLVKLGYLSEGISNSIKYFRYMIISEVAKMLVFVWVFGLSQTREHNTGLLLAGFVFALIEATLLFLAFNSLFEGITSLGFLHKNKSVLGSERDGGRSYTEKIRSFTLFFVIFKAVMSVLPEFSNLASHEYDENGSLIDLYEYIGLMRGMSFFVVTVIGVVWLFKIIRYFSRVRNDSEFCASLTDTYVKDILPKRALFIKKNVNLAAVFFIIGAVCMLDIRIDYVNVIPDALGAIAFFVGFLILSRYVVSLSRGRVLTIASVYLCMSLAAGILEMIFFDKYYYGAIYRNTSAYTLYVVMCVFAVLSTAASLAVAASFIVSMNKTIKEHTGFVYGTGYANDTARIESYQKESRRRLIFPIIAAVFMAAGDIFYTFFAVRFNFAGFLNIILTLVFAVSVIKTVKDISDDVETKYMLE